MSGAEDETESLCQSEHRKEERKGRCRVGNVHRKKKGAGDADKARTNETGGLGRRRKMGKRIVD